MRVNRDSVDPWTFVHVGAGGIAGAAGVSPPVVLLAAVAWEVVEASLKRSHPKWFPTPSQDSASNSVVDIFAATGASCLTYRGRKR